MSFVSDELEYDDLTPLSLSLLGGFRVDHFASPVELPVVAQLMLALVALNGGSVHRVQLITAMWPDASADRGLANLRAVRWRMPEPVRSNVNKRGSTVALSESWTVDFDIVCARARQINESGCCEGMSRRLFSADLLPDWDASWLIVLRERHRQLRLHALEAMAAAELRAGRPLDAVDTALAAVADEPLRESAQFLLLQAHLAAGNRANCFEQYAKFCELLRNEIGVEPGERMYKLVRSAGYPI